MITRLALVVLVSVYLSACAGKASRHPVLLSCDEYVAANVIATEAPDWKTALPGPPVLEVPAGASVVWVLQTNKGSVRIDLLPQYAPKHVSSTIFLTEIGFYDGLSFHRVIPGFMAQGGCPLGDGRGGPGYKYEGEYSDEAKHDGRGILSMANAGPGTDGSQFFLTFTATPNLDGRHTVFGKVAGDDESQATLGRLEALGNRANNGVPPLEPIVIEQASIEIE